MAFATITIQNDKGTQAIKLPDNFKINDDKVYVKKLGNAIYLIPFHNPWQNLFESLDQFIPDFMEDRNQATEQNRETFD